MSEGTASARRRLPRPSGGVGRARRWTGLALAAAGLPATTAILAGLRGVLALQSVLLLYLLAVVIVAAVGGVWPALLAACASFALANFFFARPYHAFHVAQRDSVIALSVFLAVAFAVSVAVDLAARWQAAAARSRAEAEIMSRVAAEPVAEASLDGVLRQVRSVFGMDSVALLERRGDAEHEVARVGTARTSGATGVISAAAGPGLRLVGEGPPVFAEDRRVLAALARAAGKAVEGNRLAARAAHARELAEIDRVRAALLAAVGHDLRTPLAGIKAAVSGLRQDDVDWAESERRELLATIEESADRLGDLIANLLDMSRLQAGTLSLTPRPCAPGELVARVLLQHGPAVHADIPENLPDVLADPGLCERVIANLLDNARRHSPPGSPIRVAADADGATVTLRVVDHGPGVPRNRWEEMFQPFQRLDDRSAGGTGLGLAIARGFTEAMGGTLRPSATPGGGLTMSLTLPAAPAPSAAPAPPDPPETSRP